jgi:hypothetical protein
MQPFGFFDSPPKNWAVAYFAGLGLGIAIPLACLILTLSGYLSLASFALTACGVEVVKYLWSEWCQRQMYLRVGLERSRQSVISALIHGVGAMGFWFLLFAASR